MKADAREDREGRVDSPLRGLQGFDTRGGHIRVIDVKFAHLTTKDGLSQSTVTEILQDRRGFMSFATRDGLDRYDGNTFVVYKHNPNDPGSLSANYIWDLMEDDQGYLWIATDAGGVNKFDPRTERFTRYRHDPSKSNSLSSDGVASMARDSRGYLWFGTLDSGLDKLDPSTGTFTHYRNDSDGRFVERITKVIEDSHRDIWFVGGRGLFHLNPKTGEITHPPAYIKGLAADYVCEDDAGNLWMLAYSPIVGLVKYDRQTGRFTDYRFGARTVGVPNSNLLADGQNGFWVPSSQGLYYFDRRTERFNYLLQHDEINPDSLNDNSVAAIYQDRGGVLWVGTVEGGLNLLNLQQKQFGFYHHLPNNANSLSPGRVTTVYEEPSGILWVGFFPRVLDRLDRKTGKVVHYLPGPGNKNALGTGIDIESIYQDARGYLWLGGWGGGLDRFDKYTGQFKHYVHKPADPNSLISNGVYSISGDRSGHMWVGEQYGLSLLDPATERFTHYSPDPENQNKNGNRALAIYQDRTGTLWVGRGDGVLSRFDDKSNTFVNYAPDSRDPHRLQGGSIIAIHEDRAGTLWVGSWSGLYRYNRQDGTFTRYTESQGLPSSAIQGILDDKGGRLWLSTKKGICRFDPQTETFRNYDASDGLQGDEFSESCYFQGANGEMFFGGNNGFNSFFPENIQDNPYVPPVVITNFKIKNRPVPIGANSALKKAIPYVDSLTLSYRDNVFSFEFAALSYANSHKNRYRYKLENFDPGWNDVDSKQRLATYTNLDPGKYVFRVQGSNSDGVWNEVGVSLPILITPPWWKTNSFRALCAAFFLALLWAAHQFRIQRMQHEFKMRLEGRVDERLRVARELHDTMLQSFQAALIQMQAARNIFGRRPEKTEESLDKAINTAAGAIAEGRSAIQDLRLHPAGGGDLAQLLTTAGQELARSEEAPGNPPAFGVTVEGEQQDLKPLLQDEVYRIARELLRNAFHHAQAGRIEVEIRYESRHFRVHVRDDGKGIEPEILKAGGRAGHYGMPGMRERVDRFGGKLEFWSKAGAGTEAVLTVPAVAAYANSNGGAFSLLRRKLWIHER